MPKYSLMLSGQHVPLDAQAAQFIKQLHGRRLAHQAIGVADNGDLLATLDRAGKRQRAHRAGQRPSDDVAGVPEPDELLFGYAQYLGHEPIQPRIDAGQGDDRQVLFKVSRMQTRFGITGKGTVICIQDGFEQAHGL